METFLSFFENMPAWQKLSWIIVCISANWLVELGIPLMSFNYKKWRHAGVNLVFLSIDMLLNVLIGIATLGLFAWMATNQFGLLYRIDLPLWAELLIAIAALDFMAQYLVHFLLHKVKFMWRFHMVHHSDTHVDATTATRHHPIDYLFREVFAFVTVLALGIPLAFYVFYRMLTLFFGYFTHANIALPMWLDKVLNVVFVTPNMHKFHHHHELPWTDSNYGNILSIWDRMFGTLTYEDPKDVHYGLDLLDHNRDEDILYQLKVPFDASVKYKD